ncbi:MAG: hypothetical protein ACJ74M_02845 [Gaiellaceae bacterium]
MTQSREERIGLNEAVFREVNERIESLAETFDLGSQPLDLICECGDVSCAQRIQMTHAEFEELRSDPHQFAISPGHEIPDVEDVIAKRRGYDVVKKHPGEAQEVAEHTDRRTG